MQARYADPAGTGRAGGDPGPPTLLEQGCPVRPTQTIRPHLLPALFLGAAAVACNGAEGKSKGAAGRRRRRWAAGRRPCRSRSAVARTDTVVDAILATGQIEAMQSIELRPDIEGRIAEILVREGRHRWRGARRSSRWTTPSCKAQVARAEADRDLARQSLARTRELLGQKASSQSELERAEATARSNEAQLALLKVRLDRTVVRAPFAGVVGQRYVSLGDYVTTEHPAAHLQTVSPQRAVVPGARALRRPAQGGAAGDLPGGRAARAGVHRAGGLRGSRGAASRAHHHRQGGGPEPQARAAGRHVHRGPARHGGAARRPWSFRRTR